MTHSAAAPVVVPSIEGLDYDGAFTAVVKSGLVFDHVASRTNENVPRDRFFGQTPRPGEVVKAGTIVKAFRSLGSSAPVRVPAVVGLTVDVARERARAASLGVKIAAEEHAEAPVFEVLRQAPAAGAETKGGGEIEVVLSKGLAATGGAGPDPEAIKALLAAKFGAQKAPKQPKFPLLVRAKGAAKPDGTRIGGAPRAPKGTAWPSCATCGKPMQFVAQVRIADAGDAKIADGLVLVFQCAGSDKGCDTWEANGGCNAAIVVPLDGLERLAAPAGAPALLPEVAGEVRTVESPPPKSEDRYDDNRRSQLDRAVQSIGGGAGMIVTRDGPWLGLAGGKPDWVQEDDTPKCSSCKKTMRFVAQFGDAGLDDLVVGDAGQAYVFACQACRKAKFFWQSC
jgi:hypothetical protein